MTEIASMVHLPNALAKEWYNRGYYGTVNHDSKAVYQKYLGWFDANPANLNPLPPVETSKKMVEYMGGEDAVLKKAQQDYDLGNYRWVVQALNYVVFANPDNAAARELEAKAFEQLGFQAESGPWRNFYLTGALELRQKDNRASIPAAASPDIIRAMSLNEIFDYMAVRLNGEHAAGRLITLNMQFPDINEQYIVQVKNSVLNHFQGKQAPNADVTLKMDRKTLDALTLKEIDVKTAQTKGLITVTGNPKKLAELFNLLDTFDPSFNIVTP
jgi:alkyl sulfatase BDS1-like metallo-beta-lactamase superfamily hydrolase